MTSERDRQIEENLTIERVLEAQPIIAGDLLALSKEPRSARKPADTSMLRDLAETLVLLQTFSANYAASRSEGE